MNKKMPKRMYFHATGSTCYNSEGITWPEPFVPVKWSELEGIGDIGWSRQFGWQNQPEVLCFTITDPEAFRATSGLLFHLGLMPKEMNW